MKVGAHADKETQNKTGYQYLLLSFQTMAIFRMCVFLTEVIIGITALQIKIELMPHSCKTASYAGISLTGYHPPGHPGAFAPKCVPSPRAFAQ